MSNKRDSQKAFYNFALEIRTFERTLYGLVASSFVLSGVAAIAKARFADPALLATITLIGTVAGCGAIMSAYFGWANRPEDEYRELVLFDAASSGTTVRVYIALSLVSLLLYATTPIQRGLPLLFVVLGCIASFAVS
jgi:hypothetical protein